MVFVSCFANFELKQRDSVGRMTAQPLNHYVFFCIVVSEFAVNGNQTL